MNLENLITRLEWALSIGIKHGNVVNHPTEGYLMITGKTSNGTIQQIYPMSDEERGYKKPFKSKKETKHTNTDNWKYSDRDDDFNHLDDDYFGSENSWNESIKKEKIKEEFKRFL